MTNKLIFNYISFTKLIKITSKNYILEKTEPLLRTMSAIHFKDTYNDET